MNKIKYCLLIVPFIVIASTDCFAQRVGSFGVTVGFSTSSYGDFDEEKGYVINYPILTTLNIGAMYQHFLDSSFTLFGQLNFYQNGSKYEILGPAPVTCKISYISTKFTIGAKYKIYKKLKAIGGLYYAAVLTNPKVSEKIYSSSLGFFDRPADKVVNLKPFEYGFSAGLSYDFNERFHLMYYIGSAFNYVITVGNSKKRIASHNFAVQYNIFKMKNR